MKEQEDFIISRSTQLIGGLITVLGSFSAFSYGFVRSIGIPFSSIFSPDVIFQNTQYLIMYAVILAAYFKIYIYCMIKIGERAYMIGYQKSLDGNGSNSSYIDGIFESLLLQILFGFLVIIGILYSIYDTMISSFLDLENYVLLCFWVGIYVYFACVVISFLNGSCLDTRLRSHLKNAFFVPLKLNTIKGIFELKGALIVLPISAIFIFALLGHARFNTLLNSNPVCIEYQVGKDEGSILAQTSDGIIIGFLDVSTDFSDFWHPSRESYKLALIPNAYIVRITEGGC